MITAIKARLGSLPKKYVETFPPVVRTLLEEDLPYLIRLTEALGRAASQLQSEVGILLHTMGRTPNHPADLRRMEAFQKLDEWIRQHNLGEREELS